ncbi:hypothetical protein N656DRAFT_260031 [Canariomyces notabilis]|uniref:Uncharacterized protein n=1 Tax=Canariomyces notabilis TaxID=2074819 RepID=A0AAN6TM48_9PEZI|nr:hypothetical protein N656DRAFT_260031 [Canariomyces arenarius]
MGPYALSDGGHGSSCFRVRVAPPSMTSYSLLPGVPCSRHRHAVTTPPKPPRTRLQECVVVIASHLPKRKIPVGAVVVVVVRGRGVVALPGRGGWWVGGLPNRVIA